jgi:tetratricopeptide (TPR) repeat protein
VREHILERDVPHERDVEVFSMRGANVTIPLLVEFYHALPQRRANEADEIWNQRWQTGLENFKHEALARYNEGTLQRLLDYGTIEGRQAAVLALSLVGTVRSNEALAALLHDEDVTVRHMAADAMWAIWFRADSPENNQELQRLMQLNPQDPDKIRTGFEALLKKAPRFAEAYNQRAVHYFRLGDYQKSIEDCEKVLKLNPFHFGAAGGLAQCYMKQNKLRSALRAFRRAFRINPNLEGMHQVIRSLERLLGEEGKK